MIAATGILQQVPVKFYYSKELAAYLTAMLSTVQYSKSSNSSINCLMDEEYKAALHCLRWMTNKAFNDYIVCRMASYIDRWPVANGRADADAGIMLPRLAA